jgi:hypothetical protein
MTIADSEDGKYTYKTLDDTLLVYENGVIVDQNQYSIDGNTLTLGMDEYATI